MSNQPNRVVVEKALDVIENALNVYVKKVFTANKKDDWKETVRRLLINNHRRIIVVDEIIDVDHLSIPQCIAVIISGWNDYFSNMAVDEIEKPPLKLNDLYLLEDAWINANSDSAVDLRDFDVTNYLSNITRVMESIDHETGFIVHDMMIDYEKKTDAVTNNINRFDCMKFGALGFDYLNIERSLLSEISHYNARILSEIQTNEGKYECLEDLLEETDAKHLAIEADRLLSDKRSGNHLAKAAQYYWLSIANGDMSSCTQLGHMYLNGTGVNPSEEVSSALFNIAASEGDREGQYMMAISYRNGRGIQRSYDEYSKIILKLASEGYTEAQAEVGRMYYYGLEAEKSYEKASKWSEMAAKKGNINSMQILGSIYMEGIDGKKNYERAFYWYSLLIEKIEDKEAFFSLGWMCENGLGVFADIKEAKKWYALAVKKGDTRSQFRLNMLGENNLLFNLDEEKIQRINDLAMIEDRVAQFDLGWIYEHGVGIEQSDFDAMWWYTRSAENGDPTAQLLLGYYYENGFIVEQSNSDAIEWYTKSADQNDKAAVDRLIKYKTMG